MFGPAMPVPLIARFILRVTAHAIPFVNGIP